MKEDQNVPSFHIVWQSPIRIQPPPKIEKIPSFPFFSEIFHPPVFHFWAREIIVTALQKKRSLLAKFENGLFPVDVIFTSVGFDLIKKFYSNYQNDKILRELGRWLTEQVTAVYIDKFSKNKRVPDILVRCIVAGKNSKPDKWINPYSLIGKWISKRIPHIENSGMPPFYLCLRGKPPKTIKVEIKDMLSPQQSHLNWLDEINLSHEPQCIPNKKFDVRKYPLVDCKQLKLSPVIFPEDNIQLLYAQHDGKHESWVFCSKRSELDKNIITIGSWGNVPRNGWMPVRSDNIIVLGRIVKTSEEARIVPGSMVLQIEYPI